MKFRSAFLSLVMFTSLSFPALSAELKGRVDEFVSNFNTEAQALGVETIFVQTECDRGPSKTCKFEAANGIQGFVQARDSSQNASMVMMAKGDADGSDFIVALGVAMALFAPSVDKDERGAALMLMLNKLTQERVTGTAMLNGARFSLSQMEGAGIVAFVEAVE